MAPPSLHKPFAIAIRQAGDLIEMQKSDLFVTNNVVYDKK
jgi:hypothetical protein